MFNLFKRKRVENSQIENVLGNLTINQKMSVINLLMYVAHSDSDPSNIDRVTQFLEKLIAPLGIPIEKCTTHFEAFGPEKMLEDLQPLEKTQKEFIVIAAFRILCFDDVLNEPKFHKVVSLFEMIGVSDDHFYTTIEKIMPK